MSALARTLVYVAIIGAVVYSLILSSQAISLGRDIDHRGDLRACRQENLIRTVANERDAKLEKTAKTNVEALKIIEEATQVPEIRVKLRRVRHDAEKIQTSFKPAVIANCDEVFPGPKK